MIHKPEIQFREIELVYCQENSKPTFLKKIDVSAKAGVEVKKEKPAAEEEKKAFIAENKTFIIDDGPKTKIIEDSGDISGKSDKKTAYVNYESKIREMIKSVIEKNCKRISKEGNVSVRFIIERTGNIKKITLHRPSGRGMKSLENIVVKSIKQASPFPPFSREMKEDEIPLILPICFTRK
ncbi:MAG: TonB family protein [Candidatus Omnitrophota bacterium]|nr:TonB family protein [Candidatus Omnitrophota bacterium]